MSLGPEFVGGEVRHVVFGGVRIKVAATSYKLWALATPTSMLRGATVDATESFVCCAGVCSVIAGASAACVFALFAILGHMAPMLAFEAVYRLLLVLDQVEALHVIIEPFKY